MAQSAKSFDVKDEDFKKAKGSGKWGGVPVCVSVALTDQGVAVRDTEDASKTTLFFSHQEWDVFVEGVKNSEFDRQQA